MATAALLNQALTDLLLRRYWLISKHSESKSCRKCEMLRDTAWPQEKGISLGPVSVTSHMRLEVTCALRSSIALLGYPKFLMEEGGEWRKAFPTELGSRCPGRSRRHPHCQVLGKPEQPPEEHGHIGGSGFARLKVQPLKDANHLGCLFKRDLFIKPEPTDELPSQIPHKITHMLAELWEQLDI
ncbi:hypothetical protein QYF61_011234 [Mycteria americana]|uniref:Uncharacterized protein n=1 Tax=Mycteria americana TaxID=33587 RepID=A0AAN7NFV3_MYCAM|nr:hypothetical protein QYF61_011234 [Mycteria americana]